jgi:hypothetical protein
VAALALSTEFELAVRDAVDLRTRVTFGPAHRAGERGRER